MSCTGYGLHTGASVQLTLHPEKHIELEIEPVGDEKYVTTFVGTLKGYDDESSAVTDRDGKPVRTTRRYSTDVGKVLATVRGRRARYALTGKEFYVRAIVTSSQKPDRPLFGRGIAVFDDGVQPTVLANHQSAIGGRIVGPEAEHHHRGVRRRRPGRQHSGHSRRSHQRAVAEQDQHVAGEVGKRRPRRQDRMGRAKRRILNDSDCRLHRQADGVGARGGNDDDPLRCQCP